MVRFALPFGAFARLGQDIHKMDILMVFSKIQMISSRDLFTAFFIGRQRDGKGQYYIVGIL